MTIERKEGVLIVALCCAVLAVLLLQTTWYAAGSHEPATVYLFGGFQVSCDIDFSGPCLTGTKTIMDVDFELTSGLIVLVPFVTYGLLRAAGVVRRFFRFEKKLFGFALGDDE